MKKFLVLLTCIFFVSCSKNVRLVKELDEFEKRVSKYEVVEKNITEGEHYQFFSWDKYHHTVTRAEYNVVFRNIETKEVYVAKDIDAKYYYTLEKGKIYSISNKDMWHLYRIHEFM